MSIVTSHPERAAWLVAAGRVQTDIDALRAQITIALQQPVTVPAMTTLAEADVDLATARATVHLASAKIAVLP